MRKHKIAVAVLGGLIALYAIQLFIIPPDTAALTRYHLTAASVRLLSLTFLIPLVIVWAIALSGYIRLDSYAHSIKQAADGRALSRLSHGLLTLALYMPVNTIIQNAAGYLRHHNPTFTPSIIITTNYINIALLLIVAYLAWEGSRYLLKAIRVTPRSINRIALYTCTAAVAILFSYLILMNPAKVIPPAGGVAAYYLPDWLLFSTIVTPYAITWYLGMEAVQNILVYRARVKGIIYKSALGYIANGIAFSIISLLVLRSMSAQTAWFGTMTLRFILILVYALIFMIGVGYVLVWIGAKKLQLIEEV